jgi:hypothetical protein
MLLLTAVDFGRLGHLNASRYGVAVERVMTMTNNRRERIFTRRMRHVVPHADMRPFLFSFLLIPVRFEQSEADSERLLRS